MYNIIYVKKMCIFFSQMVIFFSLLQIFFHGLLVEVETVADSGCSVCERDTYYHLFVCLWN